MIHIEARTQELFSKTATELKPLLDGREIALLGSGKRILITQTQAFPEVGPTYNGMEDLQEGNWWSFYRWQSKMSQSLIVSHKEGSLGSCVRLVRASYFDSERGFYIPMPREGDIAKYFELQEYGVSKLSFQDATETLYLVKSDKIFPRRKVTK